MPSAVVPLVFLAIIEKQNGDLLTGHIEQGFTGCLEGSRAACVKVVAH